MPFYVYIIESSIGNTLYKGLTEDYHKRLQDHNAGLSQYTSHKIPWELRYVEELPTKTDALKRELMLKKQNTKYLRWLFQQPTNILFVG